MRTDADPPGEPGCLSLLGWIVLSLLLLLIAIGALT